MITIFVNNADAYVSQFETLTSGRNGMSALLLLKREHWEGLNVLVNFLTSDGTTRSAIFEPLVDFEHTQCDLSGYIPGVAVIPAKVLETPGVHLLAGVKGSNNDGTVVIPTIYCDLGEVLEGASVDGEIPQIEDGREIIELALDTAEEALTKAEEALEEISHGAMAPTVEITEIPGGHHIKITDKDGDHECDIMDGEDAVSPSASVSKSGHTATISITDESGTTTAQIEDGEDGYSPSASVSKSGRTATISITDKTGTTTAQVTDGTDGEDAISPSVSVTPLQDNSGYTVVITDKTGDHSFTIYNGEDAVSPSASVSKSGNTATISITDESGTTTAQISDGTNGISPTVSITPLQDGTGYTVVITDASGDHSFTLYNGSDGVSPSVSITELSDHSGYTLSITDATGTHSATILNGSSVTAQITTIQGGHRLSVTDKNGTQTCDILDGTSGATFTPAVDANGNISWTNDKSLPNPQTQNIKGPAGPGVPSGGTQGQFLIKQSSTDYDAAWVTVQTWQGGSY